MEGQVARDGFEKENLQRRLLFGIIHDCYEFQSYSTDFLRFKSKLADRIRKRIKDKVFLAARKGGFIRRHFPAEKASEQLIYTLRNIDKLEGFYGLLHDQPSRDLLVDLLKYRVLGGQHVKLPLNNTQYWGMSARIDE